MIMGKGHLLLMFATIVSSTTGQVNYDNQGKWDGQCQADTLQSPINIKLNGPTLEDEYLLENYNKKFQWTITNDGTSALVSGPGKDNTFLPKILIQDNNNMNGNISYKNKYLFSNFHFHWGLNNYVGSEHAIQGNRLPLEMHIVHYNEKYKTLEKALDFDDGILIVAVLFLHKSSTSSSSVLEDIGTNILPLIIESGTSKNISFEFSLKNLFPGVSPFVFYEGSLTRPPCTPAKWIVVVRVQNILIEVLKNFRKLLKPSSKSIAPNYRNIQQLHNRTLYWKNKLKEIN